MIVRSLRVLSGAALLLLSLLIPQALAAAPAHAVACVDSTTCGPTANIQPRPDGGGGSVPDCGTVHVTAIQIERTPLEAGHQIKGASFKVVGTSLKPWLGNNYGTLDVYIDDDSGVHGHLGYNASPNGGATTGTLHGTWYYGVTTPRPAIEVFAYLKNANGKTKCGMDETINYPGGTSARK